MSVPSSPTPPPPVRLGVLDWAAVAHHVLTDTSTASDDRNRVRTFLQLMFTCRELYHDLPRAMPKWILADALWRTHPYTQQPVRVVVSDWLDTFQRDLFHESTTPLAMAKASQSQRLQAEPKGEQHQDQQQDQQQDQHQDQRQDQQQDQLQDQQQDQLQDQQQDQLQDRQQRRGSLRKHRGRSSTECNEQQPLDSLWLKPAWYTMVATLEEPRHASHLLRLRNLMSRAHTEHLFVALRVHAPSLKIHNAKSVVVVFKAAVDTIDLRNIDCVEWSVWGSDPPEAVVENVRSMKVLGSEHSAFNRFADVSMLAGVSVAEVRSLNRRNPLTDITALAHVHSVTLVDLRHITDLSPLRNVPGTVYIKTCERVLAQELTLHARHVELRFMRGLPGALCAPDAETIVLSNCDRLQALECGAGLKDLNLSGCYALTSIVSPPGTVIETAEVHSPRHSDLLWDALHHQRIRTLKTNVVRDELQHTPDGVPRTLSQLVDRLLVHVDKLELSVCFLKELAELPPNDRIEVDVRCSVGDTKIKGPVPPFVKRLAVDVSKPFDVSILADLRRLRLRALPFIQQEAELIRVNALSGLQEVIVEGCALRGCICGCKTVHLKKCEVNVGVQGAREVHVNDCTGDVSVTDTERLCVARGAVTFKEVRNVVHMTVRGDTAPARLVPFTIEYASDITTCCLWRCDISGFNSYTSVRHLYINSCRVDAARLLAKQDMPLSHAVHVSQLLIQHSQHGERPTDGVDDSGDVDDGGDGGDGDDGLDDDDGVDDDMPPFPHNFTLVNRTMHDLRSVFTPWLPES
ncbi:hypothetical protein PTSG_06847 [Salpingoeca rosetta]|uniref:Uncharacterized protein n=1 Tax=Salpingoeca rosetta (strain ATCC 50818 / BSB-021) TaxID=946362 RepID=F2UEZ4_SALR5|nr:uncharacterized protein PTSG_06847 [Salpingoeca rosetta]EGD75194.1 hypothetical protein PTSG_06847 [Salpingoeca rosetta]|eukprot:XP_004992247.1 hypothetical protein PTSG_06847 [Salpingoeca rosetta]